MKTKGNKESTAYNIMYKTLGFKWLLEVFCPASAFATADSDEARNPQRFIHVTVVRNAWEARFILVRYMCEEKEEKTCPSWMLAVHGSQKTKEL